MGKLIDLTGQKFGRLTVLYRGPNANGGRAQWVCMCDCGNLHTTQSYCLRRGYSRSCGCHRRQLVSEANSTHGMRNTPEYRAWQGMKRRCYNPNVVSYPRYGGRGIKVCDRWCNSFEAFYEDMGPRLSPSHSLDRIDNDGDYEPGNVRWTTPIEQARNTCRNHLITFNGDTLTLAEWSERTGIDAGTILARLDQYGWSVEQALTTPVDAHKSRMITFGGKTHSLTEWAKISGMSISTLNTRINTRGWSIERALTEPLHKKR